MKMWWIGLLGLCLTVCGWAEAFREKSTSDLPKTKFMTLTESMQDCYKLTRFLIHGEEIQIVDIGCAVGEFVHLFQNQNRDHIRCVAIGVDPLLQWYKQVRLPYLNSLYSKLFEVAITDKPGMVTLSVNSNFLDLSSTKQIDLSALNSISHFYDSLLTRYGQAKTFSVKRPSITLNELCTQAGINRIDLLKLDTQGNEYEILNSISDDLFAKIGVVYVEAAVPGKQTLYKDQKLFLDIYRLMEKKNFALFGTYGLDDKISIETSVDMNCIFINKKIPPSQIQTQVLSTF